MYRRSLVLALAFAVVSALGIFSSSALAELTVNIPFEYSSPGMTFESQHVGPALCKGNYQVNPKAFPAKENETILGTFGPGGGREIVTCKSTTGQPLEG